MKGESNRELDGFLKREIYRILIAGLAWSYGMDGFEKNTKKTIT